MCPTACSSARSYCAPSGAARDDIEAALSAALDSARELARFYEQLVHLEHAEFAGALGDDAGRRVELEAARDLFAEMGATARARQLTKELGG